MLATFVPPRASNRNKVVPTYSPTIATKSDRGCHALVVDEERHVVGDNRDSRFLMAKPAGPCVGLRIFQFNPLALGSIPSSLPFSWAWVGSADLRKRPGISSGIDVD